MPLGRAAQRRGGTTGVHRVFFFISLKKTSVRSDTREERGGTGEERRANAKGERGADAAAVYKERAAKNFISDAISVCHGVCVATSKLTLLTARMIAPSSTHVSHTTTRIRWCEHTTNYVYTRLRESDRNFLLARSSFSRDTISIRARAFCLYAKRTVYFASRMSALFRDATGSVNMNLRETTSVAIARDYMYCSSTDRHIIACVNASQNARITRARALHTHTVCK